MLVQRDLPSWLLDNGPGEARFLTPEDRLKAVERLRSNNTGTATHHTFKWKQVFEMVTEVRGYVFFCMTLIVNMGASVRGTWAVFGRIDIYHLRFAIDIDRVRPSHSQRHAWVQLKAHHASQ